MNKKVLITGGTSDLGKEIIRVFAYNSYDVIFTYFNNEKLAFLLQEEFQKLYQNVIIKAVKLDVRDEKQVENLVKSMDRLDVLVNNAAYNDDSDFFEKTKEGFLNIISTNLVGPFLLMKNAYSLLKHNNGCIVNVASTNGIDTMYIESCDYDASKAGLINLTKNVASYFAPNVRVNAIAPGWISTKSTEDMNPEFKSSEINKIATQRFAKPEEIANVVYFLSSKEASYINGAIIRVDGGTKYGF